MIKVHHLNLAELSHRDRFDTMLNPSLNRIQSLFDEGYYTAVAEVTTENRDVAFELTNHIIGDWRQNGSVQCITSHKVRSTSVGDILEMSDGTLWCVAAMGFEQLKKA